MENPEEGTLFRPGQQAGLAFQAAAAAAFSGFGAWAVWRALHTQPGPLFLLYLVPALLAVLFVPLLAYRFYALWRAYYIVSRDGLVLHWGLRTERLPVDQVLWVRRAEAALPGGNAPALPLPWLRWPGAVLGQRSLPPGGPLEAGQIEYLAGSARGLVLVATPQVIYAVSPADAAGFLETYRRCSELGSTTPLEAGSTYPTFLIARVWRTGAARALILAGLALNLALLAAVVAVVPTRSEIILGFLDTAEPVPAVRLMLLPLLSAFFFLVDFFLGLFFFRMGGWGREPGPPEAAESLPEPEGQADPALNGPVLAYLLWGSSVLTALLFFAAVGFILAEG